MASSLPHKWIFAPWFRRNAFGWRSQPALARVKEAVSEIKKTVRKNPVKGDESLSSAESAWRGPHIELTFPLFFVIKISSV